MENASKALLISGGILIAMLIISIAVFLFANYNGLGTSYEQTLDASEIQKFNEKFLKFEGRKDITIQEVVSLANFAREYNAETGSSIQVMLQGSNLVDNNELTEKIKSEMDKAINQKYKATIAPYNRLIERITFSIAS